MGLEKAKSLLEVADNKNFLDITAEQIQHQRKALGVDVGFLLMNSFSTAEDTKNALEKHEYLGAWDSISMMQNKVPKILQDGSGPAECTDGRADEWCPPGH